MSTSFFRHQQSNASKDNNITKGLLTSNHGFSNFSMRPLGSIVLHSQNDDKSDYGYDVVIVVNNPDEQIDSELIKSDYFLTYKEIIERLNIAGFLMYLFYSVDKKQIFIKLKAPLEILHKHAGQIDFPMKLDG